MDRTPVVRTLVLTDLVNSTMLLSKIGDAAFAELNARHDSTARKLCSDCNGREIDRTDGFLLAFERPIDALRWALRFHHELAALSIEAGVEISARIGIHLGEVILSESSPEEVERGASPVTASGLAVPICARIMSLATSRQTLLTKSAFDLARRSAVGAGLAGFETGEERVPEVIFLAHGAYSFKGVEEPIEVCEAGIEGVAPLAPPANSEKAKRMVAGEVEILGWRASHGQDVPHRPNWVLEERLGEGGFGEVWLARHKKNKGALRVYKFCYNSERLRALKREATLFRLLHEALGDREDIQAVLDWNFEEAPYYLESEYTDGKSLLGMANESGQLEGMQLSTRLNILAQAAKAVSAAHSVGVIHKDIKPSNLLLKKGDPSKVILIDFGIGTVIDRRVLDDRDITVTDLTEAHLSENNSSRTGTRLYTAPELVEGKQPTIQSDVYALGVILYQLCVSDLRKALAPGWQANVEDEFLREDILACTHGDPNHRLKSADEVAERIQSLEARREKAAEELATREALSAALRRRKMARASAGVMFALGAIAACMSVLYFQAEAARSEAAKQRDLARIAQSKAELNLAIAQENSDGAFDLIGFVLEDLKQAMDEELTEEKGISQELQNELSFAIAGRVATPVVDYFLKRDLSGWPEELTLDFAEKQHRTGDRFNELGRFSEAAALTSPTIRLRTKLLGRGHPDTVASLNNLSISYENLGLDAQAMELREEVLEARLKHFGPEHPKTLQSMTNLAVTYKLADRAKEALALEEEALEHYMASFGPEHPETLMTLHNIATTRRALGEREEALKINEKVLAIRREVLGTNHPDTLSSLANLAIDYRHAGKTAESIGLKEELCEIYVRMYGPEHPKTVGALKNLAIGYKSVERWEEEKELRLKVYELRGKLLGKDHPDTLSEAYYLAASLARLMDHENALHYYDLALSGLLQLHEPDHEYVMRTREKILREALHLLRKAREVEDSTMTKKWAEAGTQVIGDYATALVDPPASLAYYAECLLHAERAKAARQFAQEAIDLGYPNKADEADEKAFEAVCIQLGLNLPEDLQATN